MIIGHIGARKGSKGVPGKNFLPICGKPLIDGRSTSSSIVRRSMP